MPSSNIKYQISNIGNLKVAIVADWIYGGGSERVVYELHKMFPDAPIYTSYCSDAWRKKLDNKVVTGYLQHSPFKQLRKFLPLLRQWWFSRLNLSEFDLVISSSGNGESKFVLSRSSKWQMKNNLANEKSVNGKSNMQRPLHISYCHTPVHFYWRHYNEYLQNPGFKPEWLARVGLKLLIKPLRARDYRAAQKVDYFIANSTHIQKDIKKFYGRDSVVIHPPVDIKRFSKPTAKYHLPESRQGFVTMGRQVPLKKVDLIIEACKQLKEPLVVIGNGPDHQKLLDNTGPTIHFKTHGTESGVSDADMPNELASAKAFIFASHEDFGIAPVEAMAAGTPVIAYKAGGALDYVIPGKTGEFFDKQSVESIAKAIESFNSKKYKPETIKKEAEKFSANQFAKNLKNFLETV